MPIAKEFVVLFGTKDKSRPKLNDTQVLRYDSGSAIRPKNSRLVAPPGFMLRDTADFSGLDVQIFYDFGSYDSPESPLSL